MYQVGGTQGESYRNEQGKGLATTLDPTTQGGSAFQANLKAEADKQAAIAKSLSTLQSSIPEYWSEMDGNLSKRKDALIDEFATYIAENNGKDIMSSTDPKSIEYQKKWSEFVIDAKQSMQFKDWYKDNTNDARTAYDKYTPESVAAVVNFPYENDVNKLLKGEIPLPQLKLKAPASDMFSAVSTIAASVTPADPTQPPTAMDYVPSVATYLQSEKNKLDTKAFAETFAELPTEAQNMYCNDAVDVGLGNTESAALVYFVASQAAERKQTAVFNDAEWSLSVASKAPTKKTTYSNESGGVTKSGMSLSVVNKDAYADTNARAAVATKWASIRRNPILLADAGITNGDDMSTQMNKMVEHLANKVKIQYKSESASGRAESEAYGNAQATKQEQDTWLARLRSGVVEQSKMAAAELIGRGAKSSNGYVVENILQVNGHAVAPNGVMFLKMATPAGTSSDDIANREPLADVPFEQLKTGVATGEVFKTVINGVEHKVMAINVNDRTYESSLMTMRFGQEKEKGYNYDVTNPNTEVGGAGGAVGQYWKQ